MDDDGDNDDVGMVRMVTVSGEDYAKKALFVDKQIIGYLKFLGQKVIRAEKEFLSPQSRPSPWLRLLNLSPRFY